MKRKSCLVLAFMILVFSLISIFSTVSASAETKEADYDVYRLSFANFIADGIADEPEWAKIPKSNKAVWFGDSNDRLEDEIFQAHFKAAWTPSQASGKIDVYFLIEVTDNTFYENVANWANDAFSLFLYDPAESAKRWTGFTAVTDASENLGFTNGTDNRWAIVGIQDHRASDQTDTYTIEFKYTFSKQDKIGFDFWIQDNYTGITEYGRFSRNGTNPTNSSFLESCNIKDEIPPIIVETMPGASIRVDTENKNLSGIRFASKVDVVRLNELENSGATVTTGTLIVPTLSLLKKGVSAHEFNKETLETLGFIEGVHYYDIVNEGNTWVKDQNGQELVGTWYGTIYNIRNFEREFSAIGYVTVEKNGVKTTVYGGYESDHARSVSFVAQKTLENETLGETGNWNSLQEEILKEFISPNTNLSAETYRIMQYNILHQDWAGDYFPNLSFEERANNVANAIIKREPDVLLLTERFEEWAGEGADSVDLLRLLGDHYSILQDRITYEGLTAVNRTPIVYNSLRFKCVESGFERLPEAYSFSESANHVKKVLTWAILEDISNTALKGTQIAVFVTHWDATEENNEWRQKQSEITQAFLNSEKFKGLPMIIGGDFNAVYTESFYGELLSNCYLTDADMANDNAIDYNSVDHIAVSRAGVVSYVARAVFGASDHNPIYCDIKIRRSVRLDQGERGYADHLQDFQNE